MYLRLLFSLPHVMIFFSSSGMYVVFVFHSASVRVEELLHCEVTFELLSSGMATL
jgi:hypothetical protein